MEMDGEPSLTGGVPNEIILALLPELTELYTMLSAARRAPIALAWGPMALASRSWK